MKNKTNKNKTNKKLNNKKQNKVKTFKKANGALYKDKLIEIKEDGIYLI